MKRTQTHAKPELQLTVSACQLGQVLIATSARGLAAIFFGEQADQLRQIAQSRFPGAIWRTPDLDHQQLARRVLGLLDYPLASEPFALDLRGTQFQQQVWRALMQIPAGETISYSELAQRVGRPRAVRAAASACAANPLALVVPCHRVLRQSGELGGYAWGLGRKQYLLDTERSLQIQNSHK